MRIVFYLLIATTGFGQWIVNDPVNTAVNSAVQAGQAANHLEVMRQWAEQLESLNRQLRQLEQQLAVQQRIRDVMGDPSAAGGGMLLRELGLTDLAREYGDTLAATRRLANAVESLQRTANGIYAKLEDRTSLGESFVRDESIYRRYAAVERQADAMERIEAETAAPRLEVQREIAVTLEQLKAAGTQAEVDKLTAKLSALQAQAGRLETVRRDELAKLQTQQLLNDNQAAKERQDLLERQLKEEAQSLRVLGTWQEALKVKATDYTRP